MKTTRQSGLTVLCLLIFAAIITIISSIFIFQIAKLAKRLDGGRVPPGTNSIEDMRLPSTNGSQSFAVALEWHYEWLTFPDADVKPEPVRAQPIQFRIWIEAGQLRLEPLREEWQAVPAASVLELDADGLPVNWRAPSSLQGTPVTIEWSPNLRTWTNAGTVNIISNAIYQDSRAGFYRARK